MLLIRDLWNYFKSSRSDSSNSRYDTKWTAPVRIESIIAHAITIARSAIYFYNEYQLLYQQFEPKFSVFADVIESMRIGHAGIVIIYHIIYIAIITIINMYVYIYNIIIIILSAESYLYNWNVKMTTIPQFFFLISLLALLFINILLWTL